MADGFRIDHYTAHEIAERVDRFSGVDNGPQILLGTRQAF